MALSICIGANCGLGSAFQSCHSHPPHFSGSTLRGSRAGSASSSSTHANCGTIAWIPGAMFGMLNTVSSCILSGGTRSPVSSSISRSAQALHSSPKSNLPPGKLQSPAPCALRRSPARIRPLCRLLMIQIPAPTMIF
eukprot:Amastigsp_a183336_16.p3 type:complete len:137 gc:universal Amastigsp_a183336_16:148-558(+)